ncbi:MAG TPA: hypothetical protein VJ765_09150 [Chitinophagaceae bacterium]|nr:hypothetical protein [Chitinophagaceae bacterium]
MKKLFIILLISLFVMQSCVTSLQPLATYNTAVIDDRLAGTWNSEGQDYEVQKFFDSDLFKYIKKEMDKYKGNADKELSEKEMEDFAPMLYFKSYVIKYTKDKIEYVMFGSMVKLNGQFFINFAPIDINTDKNKEQAFEITSTDRLATHTIARLQFTNSNTVKLDFIDGGFLYDQVKAGRMKIKNERDDLYDTFLITASTDELQQFIQKYGNDDRFFTKENSVTLIRKS